MTDYVIRTVQTDEEFTSASQLAGESFAGGDRNVYERSVADWQRFRQQPGFTYDKQFILIADGQVVSHAIFDLYTLQYGRARIEMAGVGAVCTQIRYQGRGYNAAVMRACVEDMHRRGVPLTMLNGIAGYYHRFGYSAMIPDYIIEIEAAQALKLDAPLTVREMLPDDLPQLQALYARHWLEKRPTLSRPPEVWAWQLRVIPPRQAEVVVDSTGRVRGYLAGRGATSTVTEVVADDVEAAQTLLAAAGRRYKEQGETAIRWCVPPDDAFVHYARQVADVTLHTEYSLNAGWMGCIVDGERLLAALAPEFRARAGDDAAVTWTEDGRIRIGSRQDEQVVCVVSQKDFLQLLSGALAPDALALDSAITALLDTLFQARPMMVGPWDWF